jgi:hypothetical protein
MSFAEAYEASHIKRRRRKASRDEMEARAELLIPYAREHGPVTVRQLYYQAEVRGISGIDKTVAGYNKIQRQVLDLRRAGRLPYTDIADLTRWMRKPETHDSVEAALRSTARFYRKALWRDSDTYLEIWCEKGGGPIRGPAPIRRTASVALERLSSGLAIRIAPQMTSGGESQITA